ncbi:MAG: alpha/beta fold hydrolase [Candidatus Dormibacteria bacterium]
MATALTGWLAEARIEAQPRFVRHRLGRLHALELGRGPQTLLILPGLGASAADFAPLMAQLQDHYRVLALDRPGSGLSDPVHASGSPRELWEQCLGEVADQLELGRFHLLGHSLGGLVAGSYAIAHPDRFGRLVLLSPLGLSPTLPWMWNLALLPGAMPAMRALERAATRAGRVQLSLTLTRRAPRELTGAAARYRQLLQSRPVAGTDLSRVPRLLRPLHFRPEASLLPALGLVADRTLVVWGEEDLDLPYEDAREALSSFPSLRLRLVPGATHLLPFEDPALVARLVREGIEGPAKQQARRVSPAPAPG